MSMLVAAALLSGLGLAVGPGLIALGRGDGWARTAIGGFTFGVIPPLVVTYLLPHLYEEGGVAVPLLAIGGYAGAAWLDRSGHRSGARDAVVFPALAVHSLLDGAALASAFAVRRESAAAGILGLALVAHRVPEGLLIGATFVPRIGLRATLQRMCLLVAATSVGVLGGAAFFVGEAGAIAHPLIALVLGVLLHSVVHGHDEPSKPGAWAVEAAALLAGTVGVLGLSWRHGARGVIATSLGAALVRFGPQAWRRMARAGNPESSVSGNAAECNRVAGRSEGADARRRPGGRRSSVFGGLS
jgi:hypothetical protein